MMKLVRMLAAVGIAISLTACGDDGGGGGVGDMVETKSDNRDELSEVLVDEIVGVKEHAGVLFQELPDKTWVMCVYFERSGRAGGVSCDFDRRYKEVPEEYRVNND